MSLFGQVACTDGKEEVNRILFDPTLDFRKIDLPEGSVQCLCTHSGGCWCWEFISNQYRKKPRFTAKHII